MYLYRIGPEQFLDDFSGRGASFQDGARWNHIGSPVIYFGLSPATAMIEMANYLPSPSLVPRSYKLGQYTLPDKVKFDELKLTELPDDWYTFPHPKSTQDIGTQWLMKSKKLLLIVPSSSIPGGLEKNAVINPLHPDVSNLKLVEKFNQIYDERMFQKG